MKRLLLLLCAALLLPATETIAATETVDGITWSYTKSNGAATITGIPKSTAGDVVIPSKLGGCRVKTIGEDALLGCKEVTSITIPNGVTSIGSGAFYGCNGLTSVMIGKDVETIYGEGVTKK